MVDFNINTTFDIAADAAFAASTTVLNADTRAIGANVAGRAGKNVLAQSRSSAPTTIWMRSISAVSGNRVSLDWAFFDSLGGSYWTGGTAEIWRITNGTLSRVRTSDIVASTTTYIDLDADGGTTPLVGDMIVARRTTLQPSSDNVSTRLLSTGAVQKIEMVPYETGFGTRWNGEDADGGGRWVDDATDGVFARYTPTSTKTDGRRLDIFRSGGLDQSFYRILETGKTYVFEFEMRGTNGLTFNVDNLIMPAHTVTAVNGATVSTTFPVTGFTLTPTWQTFSIEYEITAQLTTDTTFLGPVLANAGTYDLREFKVYEKDGAFGGLTTAETARFAAANLDHIRDHTIIKTNTLGAAYNFERLVKDFIHYSIGNTVALGVPNFWLQPEWYTYDDADMLVDYLSGTAGTTGADLRIALGRTAPWTDDLHFIFEISNETWNVLSGFYNFPQMTDSATATVYSYDIVYGKFFQLYIDKMKTSAAFNAADFTFIVGGRHVTGYGDIAARHAPDATLVGRAPYVGGWEVGAPGAQETPTGFFEVLNWTPTQNADYLTDNDTYLAAAITAGANANIKGATYEDAVSYASLPPNIPTEELRFAKTVAAATGWIDKVADQFSRYSIQSLFTMEIGEDWASHSPQTGLAYPHQLWTQAWNNNCAGSSKVVLQRVAALKAITVNATAYTDVPELGCYMVETATGWAVLVVNRNIPYDAIDGADALYDAADSGARSVQIDVPQGSYTVVKHTMSGDFNDQNFDSAEATYNATIAISQTSMGASNGRIAETIPASKAVLYVFTG